jgi:uncharacterized protein with PIN domain
MSITNTRKNRTLRNRARRLANKADRLMIHWHLHSTGELPARYAHAIRLFQSTFSKVRRETVCPDCEKRVMIIGWNIERHSMTENGRMVLCDLSGVEAGIVGAEVAP